MMTWNKVDLPEPVLPATSACCRVPLPISRYCSFVAPERPIGTRSSSVVSSFQISGSVGATCSNGTSTRLEFLLRSPICCRNSVAKSGGGGASKINFTPGARQSDNSKPLSVRTRHTLFLRSSLIPMNECINAATRAVRGDVAQPPRGGLAKIHRERRDDEEVIFFRDAAGLRVVFRDGRVFVAQIHLDDFLHVIVQLRELLLELRRLRPDAAVEAAFVVVRQVRQRGKILSEADGIKNREAQFPRRRGGQQTENNVVDRTKSLVAAGLAGLE